MTKKRQEQYHQYFMKVAEDTAQLSHARRSKVGALIVLDNRILTQGHNGRATGCDDNCEIENPDGTLTTRPDVIHAEANALYFCAKNGLKTDGTTLYTTLSPCVQCSLGIIQAGIKEVYYRTPYRDTSGIEFLRKNNIKVEQLKDITKDKHE